MRKLIVIAVLLWGLYYMSSRLSSPRPAADSSPASSVTSPDPAQDSDAGSDVPSGDWGSGHQAGYDWAEQHDIDDEDACETAGDSHNSPSFAEGCKAYVQEQERPQ